MTNIALVVLDTLRYDAFEEFFDWLPGVRFTNVFSPGHYTIPAHAGIFTGQYPSEVGTHAKSEDLTSVPHKASSASCFCGLSSVSKRLY